MKIRETIESICVIMVVCLVAIAGFALARSCSRPDASQALAAQLRQARVDRDSAKSREVRVRDSAQQAISEQDAAWNLHVRDLVAMHQQDLQEAARAAARRARRDVEARMGVAFMPEGPDTGSGRPPCEVTLTCSEAAAWQASDSLQRFRIDSIHTQERVAAAACTTRISEVRATCESSCVEHLRATSTSSGIVSRMLMLLGIAAVGGLLGFTLGFGA